MLPGIYSSWLKFDASPELVEEGIGAKFLRIMEMKQFPLNVENKDLPDAFEVAKMITGSEEIEMKLKQMTIRANKRDETSGPE